jgi:HlyD family secretion protein
MKKRKAVLISCIVAAALVGGLFLYRYIREKSSASKNDGQTVYVQSVDNIMGTGSGLMNKFAGVVDTQETWSVPQSSDSTVKQILVSVGQTVTKGTPLLIYDTDKYQSDLQQANIDLQRIQNEISSLQSTITQLTNEKKKAAASEQANYTIQIQSQQLDLQQKQLDLQSKQLDIKKLNDNIANATVTSQIDGVVKSVSSGNSDDSAATGSSDTSLVTIMKTGDYRIKGSINEQNIGQITEGMKVIVYSRADQAKSWTGTVTTIDKDSQSSQNQNNMYYGNGDGSTTSTSYPFYVSLDSSDGLMLGQHVYIEPDNGQDQQKTGLWLYDYYIDTTDADHPFVWTAKDGKLVKTDVTLGDHDDSLSEYEIKSGLKGTTLIAMPDSSLKEGMSCTEDMSQATAGGGSYADSTITASDYATYSDWYEADGTGEGVTADGTGEGVTADGTGEGVTADGTGDGGIIGGAEGNTAAFGVSSFFPGREAAGS